MKLFVTILFGSLAFVICATSVRADEDPVLESIKRGQTESHTTTELVEEIEHVIQANPNHPQIDSLRLVRLRRLKGLPEEVRDLRSIVKEYDSFINEVGASTEVGFTAQIDVGYLLYHYLEDRESAYQHYKSMESNPILKGSDLTSEYRRVEVYTRIAEFAYASRGKSSEVDKYARLVMAYPYYGVEDSEMYKKFYDLYHSAANVYLWQFQDNAEKLLSVDIPPSHGSLYTMHREKLKKLLGTDELATSVLENAESTLDEEMRNYLNSLSSVPL